MHEYDAFSVLRVGGKSNQTRLLALAMNKRFSTRSLGDRKVHVYDGPMTLTKGLHEAVITCAWALGASRATIRAMRSSREVPIGVNRMIRSPGSRNDTQLRLGKARIATMRKRRASRAAAERAEAQSSGGKRRQICDRAKKAAANYRANPHAYHYRAVTQIANLIYLKPTPSNYRSDCSQFVSAIYSDCGIPCPLPSGWQWVGTAAMESMIGRGASVTRNPRPGDWAMYGRRGHTHHVELYVGEPGCEFIGHGSPPIDSVTPGRPNFYITLDSLN